MDTVEYTDEGRKVLMRKKPESADESETKAQEKHA
jgi:hypothetical protein